MITIPLGYYVKQWQEPGSDQLEDPAKEEEKQTMSFS